jgi:hypothetical protein
MIGLLYELILSKLVCLSLSVTPTLVYYLLVRLEPAEVELSTGKPNFGRHLPLPTNRHHDNQHNDTKHNDTKHNDIQHYNKKRDTQYNDSLLCCIYYMLTVIYAECHK